MSSQEQSVTQSDTETRLIGRVKWFNNKAGYGFITITDGAKSGTDVFVHHSAITVTNQQFKYLVQGEYVELSETRAASGPHEFQASNVLGVKGGKLMCETRNEFKQARSSYKSNNNVNTNTTPGVIVNEKPKKKPAPKVQKEVKEEVDKKEWTLVKNTSDKPKRTTRAPRKTTAAVSK